jgi:hypothetical protein
MVIEFIRNLINTIRYELEWQFDKLLLKRRRIEFKLKGIRMAKDNDDKYLRNLSDTRLILGISDTETVELPCYPDKGSVVKCNEAMLKSLVVKNVIDGGYAELVPFDQAKPIKPIKIVNNLKEGPEGFSVKINSQIHEGGDSELSVDGDITPIKGYSYN